MCAYVRRTHLYYNVYKNIVLHLYFVLCRGTHNKRAQIAKAKRDQKPQKMVYFCHCQRWIISVYFRIYYWVHKNIHRFRYIQYCYLLLFQIQMVCTQAQTFYNIVRIYLYRNWSVCGFYSHPNAATAVVFSATAISQAHEMQININVLQQIQARTHIHPQSHVPELSYFPFIQRFFSSARNRT